MIANRGRERMIGKSDFRAAVAYIVREGPQHERDHEPPLAVWCDNVASIETAALEMTATASQSKAKDPLYHLIVSWDEGEQPTYEQARAALDAQMRHLGLSDLQYVAALQNDGVGGKHHIHAVINRVDPTTHVAREIWQDRDRMQAACREIELEQGWRVVESPTHTRGLSHGARDAEYYGRKQSFERRVRDELGPALRERLAQDGATWATLHAFCREQGIRYEPVMRGAEVAGGRITGTERGEFARARDLGEDLTHRKLLEQLGAYEPDRTAAVRLPFAERCRAAAEEIAALRPGAAAEVSAAPGWARAHAAFERHGLEYQAMGTGARIADLDGPETVKPSAVDRELSMGVMTKRFGAFETTAQARERAEAREVVRHAESLVVGARLLEDPSPILERLTATRATFTLRDAERVIGEKVREPEQRQAVLEAVVAQSVVLADERGRTRLTTAAVLEAERNLDAAARGLAQTAQPIAITRDASAHLDEQQRRAYAYTVANDSRLKVVTGVPGAGKTTLIADVAAAYEEAGYRVRAVSVANAAVQVLERETALPARSIAKELHEWGQGRAQLGARDVLIVDEVSTLGTAQGAELLRAAHDRGATVLAFGDDKQFQAVAHGNALAFMQRAVGENTIDLTQTRRQREEWQREATHAVRAGDVRAALDAYRSKDCIREHDTQAQARGALVERWEQIERGGTECGIEAFTNVERIAVNELARERWRGMGRLSGADAQLETIDGRVPYAVGDRVVIRETIREAGLYNGSVGTVRGIDGAALQIERRDGEIVRVDTGAHPGVQHGYCSTEYREQGSTRYAELQLVTQHVNQRSLTVGMTRHTDAYEMFYAKETVGSYEDLVGLGLRTRSKDLASDYREQAPQREAATLARESVAEQHAPEPARTRENATAARDAQLHAARSHDAPTPKRDGYEQLRANLDALERSASARTVALERERKALPYVAAPKPVEQQQRERWEGLVREAKSEAAFTQAECDRLYDARAAQRDWNPLARWEGERVEREITSAHATRESAALERAQAFYTEHAAAEIARSFAEQRRGHGQWQAGSSALYAQECAALQEHGRIGAAREELEAIECAGVLGDALGRAIGARACENGEEACAAIATAKATLTREVSAGELRRELEPIARGEARAYDEQERAAAAAFILKQIKGLESDAQLCVGRDMHGVLRAPEQMREQARHVERAQELEQDRGMSMGW